MVRKDKIPQDNREHHKTTQDNHMTRQSQDSHKIITRQDKTRQDKTSQDETRQHNTTQHNTRQDKTRQDKTRQDKTRQDNTTQHKTPQDNTRQDNIRQDTTRQDKTSEISMCRRPSRNTLSYQSYLVSYHHTEFPCSLRLLLTPWLVSKAQVR